MEGAEEGSSKRAQFGSRLLPPEGDAFSHNAWDNVVWDEEQWKQAATKVLENSSTLVPADLAASYDQRASLFWDDFYKTHGEQFFKDRHWLFTEYPELLEKHRADGPACLLEVGCGVGNSLLPLLRATGLQLFACDFSPVAIDLLRQNAELKTDRCTAFVWDIRDSQAELPIGPNSMDYVTMIFVLSALSPPDFRTAVQNVIGYLKPGGFLFFRDYGRYDMAQLRFKNGSCISDNFYVRGDGTRVYFFAEQQVDDLLVACGLEKVSLYTDRRLQVNRLKLLKMYRVWVQATYRKPK